LKRQLKNFIRGLLARSPLANIPVRVRGGIAKGARWTLFPNSAYWRGAGERDVAAAILGLENLRGACCWDLGAHFGIYTVGLAMHVGPDGVVVAFEPDPVAHARCARHVRMNSLPNVRLFAAGVGDAAARCTFIVSHGLGSQFNHLRYEDEPTRSHERTIAIDILVLDQLVEAGSIPPPRFIKTDVEGHGAKALGGAARTLAKHKPPIVMSFHSAFEMEGTRDLLAPLGYQCYDLSRTNAGWEQALFRTCLLIA
jgi:FkbM family methyltransferase